MILKNPEKVKTMNNRYILLLLVITVIAITPSLGSDSVTISGNFADDGKIIVPLVYEGIEASGIQLEVSYLPEEMVLEEVIPGDIISGSEKTLSYRVEETRENKRIRIIIAGMNQNLFNSGILAALVFNSSDPNNPGRILPLELIASNQNGQQVQVNWRDNQRHQRRGSRDDYLMSFSRILDRSGKLFYQGSYLEKVDLYLKRIYEEDCMKKWDLIPIKLGLSGDISGFYDIAADQIRERTLLQIYRSGSNIELENNLIESKEIFSSRITHAIKGTIFTRK